MATHPRWQPMDRAHPQAPSLQWCLPVPCPQGARVPARPSLPRSCPSTPPRPAPAPHPPQRPHCPPQPLPRGAASSPGCLGPRQRLKQPLRPQVSPRSSSWGGEYGCPKQWSALSHWSLELVNRDGAHLLPPGQTAPQPSPMGRWTRGKRPLSSPEPAPAAEAPAKVQNVEDFIPEESLDRSFLDDTAPQGDEKKVGAKVLQDSDR